MKDVSSILISRLELPGCDVERLVALGNFSEIWKVVHRASAQTFAFKRLKAGCSNAFHTSQLRREESIATSLGSRYVIGAARVRFPFSERGGIALEWLPGENLEAIASSQGRLSQRQAVWIVRQIVAGLLDLHRAGYAHGDVKPANIAVLPSGEVKLIDLGFAAEIGSSRRVQGEVRPILGTIDYMAPEVFSSHGVIDRVAADAYSVGATLYRLLTGRLPFRATSMADLVRQHRTARPPTFAELNLDVNGRLADLVQRLLSKQPLRRPSDWNLLLDELTRLEIELLGTPLGISPDRSNATVMRTAA